MYLLQAILDRYKGRARGPCNATCARAFPWQEVFMEKDVVCGMQVDPNKAAGTSEYGGRTFYFCSRACKAKFDANPQQYVK